jgi:hypothetical protein
MVNVQGETLENFASIDMTEDDKKLRELLRQDGLEEELQWLTVPDPFESEWPFAKRHPGKRCAPDPLTTLLPKAQWAA